MLATEQVPDTGQYDTLSHYFEDFCGRCNTGMRKPARRYLAYSCRSILKRRVGRR